jgi:23S rRNA U2552 (ribose-2'-O)-methylase RlmE/FtsJ
MSLATDTPPPWKSVLFFKNTIHNESCMDASYNVWNHTYTDKQVSLNKLRERIHEYESGDDGKWEYYKKIINPYELVYTQKKYTNFPDSVCMIHPLSRSYFKMVEILNISDFFKVFEKEDRIRTGHVCEGPGGFIEAVIEELTRRRKVAGQLTAMTLRPNQSNVPGWKRAAQFLQKHKNIKVTFGEDNTGDITHTVNQSSFGTACGQKVHLFTSDGGFDFSTDYLQQEKYVFPLLLASTRIGFEVLKDGGYFVLKFFDTYHKATLDLLYLLSSHFRSWTLYKPATSRPCNPEQYFIGKGYKPCSYKTMTILKEWCAEIEKGKVQSQLFCESNRYPDDFESIISNIQESMIAKQTHYLNMVFDKIQTSTDEDIRAILKEHEYLSYDWCKSFNAPIYPVRTHLIEASRTGQLVSGRR